MSLRSIKATGVDAGIVVDAEQLMLTRANAVVPVYDNRLAFIRSKTGDDELTFHDLTDAQINNGLLGTRGTSAEIEETRTILEMQEDEALFYKGIQDILPANDG